jgi:histone acetyltransferase (RNA polymerase elongator complex component)
MIIPFFIPHAGCPHQCVFCNQKKITGEQKRPDPASISVKIEIFLNTSAQSSKAKAVIPGVTRNPAPIKNPLDSRLRGNDEQCKKDVHVAFYGGSFTALPFEQQQSYLGAVEPFISSGRINGIRLSTRPDCINREILALLREYHVKTIELGAQSMDDHVLARSGRGHTASDTVNAVGLLKECGFVIGLQLMPGLPGDSAEGFHQSVAQVIALKPDFVRLYPVLVIKGTPLEELYNTGRYTPLSLDDAISLCHSALMSFEQAGIEAIRIGLQPTEELERPGTILAGPYHPAFGQLVESSLFLEKMRLILKNRKEGNTTVVILVNPGDLSNAIGQKRSNIRTLQKEFRLNTLRIMPDPSLPLKTAKIL